MKTLVIYDTTGRIWSIIYGEESAPQGVPYLFTDIPEGATIERVDVTDLENPKVVFTYSESSEEQEEMKTAMMFLADTFTDDQATQVPTLYSEWSGKSISYQVGKRVRYNGILYKVIQSHVSQSDWTPENSPSLFAKVLISDPETIQEWEQPDSTNGYSTGDKVTHNGSTWKSLVDNNVWEPGALGTESLWSNITQ